MLIMFDQPLKLEWLPGKIKFSFHKLQKQTFLKLKDLNSEFSSYHFILSSFASLVAY